VNTFIRLALFLGCLAGGPYGAFRETPPPQVFEESDKVGHLLAFAALTLTALLCFPRKLAGVVIVIMFGFAASSEYLQAALRPQRFFSELDMYANISGIVIISFVWTLYYLLAIKRQHSLRKTLRKEINNI